jgi:hypothetical protein
MTGDRRWFSSLTLVVSKDYITCGNNGRGRVLSMGTMKVSENATLRHVALVKSLGFNLLSVSQLLDESFEVRFGWVLLVCWILEMILCARSPPRVIFSEQFFLSVLAVLIVWMRVFQRSFVNDIGG